MAKRIVISGYYGFGNTGDEAVLSGIIATLSETTDSQITVLSADPEQTVADHPGVSSVHRYNLPQLVHVVRNADLVISGGGSLLQDVTSARSVRYYLLVLRLAQFFRRKTMIYAQGIGPLIRPGTRRSVARVLNRVNAITVRDDDSKSLLESIGIDRVPIIQSADPAFLVKPDLETADRVITEHGLNRDSFIAVALRPWQDTDEWVGNVSAGLRLVSEELNVPIVLVPMQECEDLKLSQAVDGIVLENLGSVRTVKGVISHSGLVVAMRLHALIFAASEGVPFIPVVYDPKVSSFALLAGQSAGVDVSSVTPEALADSILQTWQDRGILRTELKAKAATFQSLALKSGEVAAALLR